jgi:hypothetical protein
MHIEDSHVLIEFTELKPNQHFEILMLFEIPHFLTVQIYKPMLTSQS